MYNRRGLSGDGNRSILRESSSIVSSEQQEPPPDGDGTQRKPTSELWGPWVVPESNDGKQENRVVTGTQFKKPFEPPGSLLSPINDDTNNGIDPLASFREHTTASARAFPSDKLNSQPLQSMPPPPSKPPSYAGYPAPVTGNPPSQTFPSPAASAAPPEASYPNFVVPSPSYQGYTSGPPGPPAYLPYGA